MKSNHYIVALVFCLAVLAGVVITFVSRDSSEPEAVINSSRTIQYSFTLKNGTNKAIPLAEFWTYAPVDDSSSHRVEKLTYSHDNTILRDNLGNQRLYFTFPDFPPFNTKIVTVKSEVKSRHQPRGSEVGDLGRFLQSEPLIETDHPEIIRLAGEIVQNIPDRDSGKIFTWFKKDDSTETARAIFDWVARKIEYTGYADDPRGALYTLRSKKGDCTEFMTLFVALCRSAGIPARGVGGYVVTENSILKPADYHNWAEFYDNGQWKIADPQKKVFLQNHTDYIATRIIKDLAGSSEDAFSKFSFKGEGLTVVMN